MIDDISTLQSFPLCLQKVEELSEELQGYKEVSGTKHADKIDKLVDNLTSDLQRKTRQILYDQLIRIKSETSHLLTGQSDANDTDAAKTTTAHDGSDKEIAPTLINNELIALDTPEPASKKARKDTSGSP